MLYSLVRPLLFALEPEAAHTLSLAALDRAHKFKLLRQAADLPSCPTQVMGLTFPNPVGLAAGMDKNGEHIDALASLGFGFIEIGTVTPKPQPGNPSPRLFRVRDAHAIINRMGFNNLGVKALVENVEQANYRGILGINIGKNAATPMARATEDYLACLSAVYAHASYVAVNISSPNTENLRDLQGADALDVLLAALKGRQRELADIHGRYVPIALKIAPDLDTEQINAISASLRRHRMDGVIATNTTLERERVVHLRHGQEEGGLSGKPLREKSTAVIRRLYTTLQNEVPIIGVGGILSANDAEEKIFAGAKLVQIYTGLIYRGPAIVSNCVRRLCRHAED
ncbi:MAG TPA: quinone-dependent dihydroorotate dehydrogenase [Thiobacillaceae bacterium]|nr:quinone-dependent dihydroorotate dehydrogenase [Thiobacillaceae bacterium]